MAGYTKLFNSILMSSVWEESAETRIVWVTLLALSDQHGHVDGTVKSLARVSRVSIAACQRAVDTFLSPDAADRSGVDEGRRLTPEQGGWLIVNHATYRTRMSLDERRDRDKLRKRQARALSAASPQTSESVRDVSQAEAEAEADQKQIRSKRKTKIAPPPPATEPPADTVLTFITTGRPAVWYLTQAQVDDWASVYAGLDVLGECRKASAWLVANGRKTASGMPRFLVSWLNRATNSGLARSDTKAPGGPRVPDWAREALAAKAKAGA